MISIRSSAAVVAIFGAALGGCCSRLAAQTPGGRTGSVDVAITYVAQRSLRANTGQNFWAEGGSVELGANAFKGIGIAADITGLNSSSIGSSGIPLSLVTETFGPRYRWHDAHRLSIYGQVLVGEVNAFHSVFPSPSGAQTEASALAVETGGGVDVALKHHLAIRVLHAAWLRTQLPNSTDNIQNNLKLGAGVVFRFGDL